MFGAQGAASKFSENGEEDVTVNGRHDVVTVPAALHPEVSPTAQISRTPTEYAVLDVKPEKEAV